MADVKAIESFAAGFAADHPTLRFGRFTTNGGETVLRPSHGGMKIFWMYAGEGEVFLPAGYRTKEGDGGALPAEYEPETISPELAEVLTVLEEGRESVAEAATTPVDAILSRWDADRYVGDFANDLWKLEHLPAPWSASTAVDSALRRMFGLCADAGYSRKSVDSWERIMEGDQLVVSAGEELPVRGSFACLTLENAERTSSHVPATMRLRYLKDSSGGCNFDFEPFRRLPLTWYLREPGEKGDSVNFVNSHVVNIAKETSPSHFHPPHGVIGDSAQNEFYLVLDPAAYGLDTHGRQASLIAYPDLHDLSRYEEHPLEPGDFVHIPPGTGHRGIDVFVNVITIPGFKPHNEYYMDRDVMETGNGAPYNPNLLHLKNYGDIGDLIDLPANTP
jgi:hypothetical protein